MSVLTGNWMSTDLVDMRQRQFKVGDKVARATVSGRSANLMVSEVTHIANGNVYLDGSKVKINYPGRLLIVTEMFP